jgi:hypothetical protein
VRSSCRRGRERRATATSGEVGGAHVLRDGFCGLLADDGLSPDPDVFLEGADALVEYVLQLTGEAALGFVLVLDDRQVGRQGHAGDAVDPLDSPSR